MSSVSRYSTNRLSSAQRAFQALRQQLEDHAVTIRSVQAKLIFPADFAITKCSHTVHVCDGDNGQDSISVGMGWNQSLDDYRLESLAESRRN